MTTAKRVPVVSNTGRRFGFHEVTPEERVQWYRVLNEYNRRLGESEERSRGMSATDEVDVPSRRKPGPVEFFPDDPGPGEAGLHPGLT